MVLGKVGGIVPARRPVPAGSAALKGIGGRREDGPPEAAVSL